MTNWIFVDCEAVGPCPPVGTLTEFGAVHYDTEVSFHGRIWESAPDPVNPAVSLITGGMLRSPSDVFTDFDEWLTDVCQGKPVFWSDNVAYDWQWINHGFWTGIGRNQFGHSGRRISDFYAGLVGDVRKTQDWKRLRRTRHDHNPVHDALGNVEAVKRILAGER